MKLATHHARSRPRGAFTLVELLVVIGIIAVLISVLLPALARSRRAAQTVACLSNLRQVGLGYYMYVNNNKGYLPFATYPSWALRPGVDPAWQPTVHWYEAISPYLGQKIDYDQTTTPWRRTTNYSKVIRACPSWDLDALGLSNTPGNDYLTGYGQNITLFLGSGKKAVGSDTPTAGPPWGDPSFYQTGLDNNPGVNNYTYAVGAVKLDTIPKTAKTILNGDSTNWFILINRIGFPQAFTWWHPKVDPGLPDVTYFDSGAPNRHLGKNEDVGAIQPGPGYQMVTTGNIAGKPATCKANYLFCDGHAETLSSDQALRAMVTRNW
jgi:prepilin-type N-terminal cleavage/methylation domain-containing protein/prepilin-type processing-associated H-X9-DG protein